MKNIIHRITTAAFALALMAGGAQAAEQMDKKDHEFLKKAAEINLTEMELGKIAERISTNPQIKEMAAKMVKDHTAANQELTRLAESKGITLPTEPTAADRREIEKMAKEQGDKFDKSYLSFNKSGHEKAVALFEKEAERTSDPEIKAWAQKMLPDLKEHLTMSKHGKLESVGEKIKHPVKTLEGEEKY